MLLSDLSLPVKSFVVGNFSNLDKKEAVIYETQIAEILYLQ